VCAALLGVTSSVVTGLLPKQPWNGANNLDARGPEIGWPCLDQARSYVLQSEALVILVATRYPPPLRRSRRAGPKSTSIDTAEPDRLARNRLPRATRLDEGRISEVCAPGSSCRRVISPSPHRRAKYPPSGRKSRREDRLIQRPGVRPWLGDRSEGPSTTPFRGGSRPPGASGAVSSDRWCMQEPGSTRAPEAPWLPWTPTPLLMSTGRGERAARR